MEILDSISTIRGGVAVPTFMNLMDKMLEAILISPVFNAAFGLLIPAGIALCVVYACIELMDKTARQSFNTENVILQIMKFLAVYALVSNIDTLIIGFGDFVSAINTDILNYLGDMGGAVEGLNKVIENNNEVVQISSGLNNATSVNFMQVNTALAKVFNIIIQVMIIKIGVERAIIIGAKSLIAPIIVPDIYHNGMNSSGIKFLKGLLGDFFATTMTIFIIEMCCIVAFTGEANGKMQYLPGNNWIPAFTSLVVLYGGLKKGRERAQQVIMGTIDY